MANTVLVVQDNQTLLAQIAAMLTQKSYVVLTASDGEEGWGIFTEHLPTAVITAVRMPNLDGLSLLKRIKNKTPDTKVILVASPEHTDPQAEALSLGATAYLFLPI